MWPMLLDMTKDECKRMLRRLELEAYSAIVTAFRAQGDLSKEKKKILQDLSSVLSISMERHRAEIRRAVNDERLATIADHMVGPNTSAEWAIEGRRLIPLMPRLVPQTAFTPIANQAANQAAAQNAQMPPPALTGNRFLESSTTNVAATSPVSISTPVATPAPSISPSTSAQCIPRQSQSPQPMSPVRNSVNSFLNTLDVNGNASNVVIVSNDTSPNSSELAQDDERNRKRRRSVSNDICTVSKPNLTLPIQNQTPSSTSVSSSTIPLSMLPSKPSTIIATNAATPRTVSIPNVKITLAPTSQKLTSTMTTSTQKVILVSGSTLNPSLLQRSLNVPIVKTVTATGTTISVTQPKTTSLIMPGNVSQALPSLTSHSSSVTTNGSLGSIVTVATSTASTTSTPVPTTTVSVAGTVTTAFMTSNAFAINKQRQKQKNKQGIVIPMGPHSLSPITQNIQIKPVAVAKSTSQLKNEGALKIITQNLPLSGNAKILPKPSTTSSGTPIVVVTSPSSITVVTKTLSSASDGGFKHAAQAGTRVVNVITSQAGRLAGAASLHKAGGTSPAIVTMNPRGLQATTVKVAAASRYPGALSVDSNNTTTATPALIMVGSKTLQTATVKVVPSTKSVTANSALIRSGSSVAKPNVIVVQKAQVMPPSSISNSLAIASSANSSSQTIIKPISTISSGSQYDKDVYNFIQRQEKMKTVTVQSLTHNSNASSISSSSSSSVNNGSTTSNVLTTHHSNISSLESQLRPSGSTATVPSVQHILTPVASTTGNVVLVEVSGQMPNESENESSDQKNTVLADILQATGILPESIPQSVSLLASQTSSGGSISGSTNEEETSQDGSETQRVETTSAVSAETPPSGQLYQLNQWIQLDRDPAHPSTQTEGFATYVELPENKENSEDPRSRSVNVLPFELQDTNLLDIRTTTDILNQQNKRGGADNAYTILQSSDLDLANPTDSSTEHQNETVSTSSSGSVKDNKEPSLVLEEVPTNESVSATVQSGANQSSVDSLSAEKVAAANKRNLDPVCSNNTMPSESGEVVGELDPQTGIFYPMPKSQEGKDKVPTIVDLPKNKTELATDKSDLVNIQESGPVSQANSLDIFSTAIASAQIDLNPFQFMEDDLLHLQESVVSQTSATSETDDQSTTDNTNQNKDASEINLQPSSYKEECIVSHESELITPSESVTKPNDDLDTSKSISFSDQTNGSEREIDLEILPSSSELQENESKTPITNGLNSEIFISNGVQKLQTNEMNIAENKDDLCVINRHRRFVTTTEESAEFSVSESERTYHHDNQENKSDSISSTNVTVEPSHLDTTTMTMEDFTSQRVDGEDFVHHVSNEVVLDAVTSIHFKEENQIVEEIMKSDECDGTSNGNASLSDLVTEEVQEDQVSKDTNESTNIHESHSEGGVRSSKRKRKAPPLPDESPPHLTGWLRSAMGILQRVSTYRGKNRAKGELNASHWFLRPVSPSVAPGYSQIIKQPMDFSTIKKKLETGCYKEMAEFNADMILIKSNCELYNPPEHPARIDCNDVFNFYQQEYDRITDKWQKTRIYMPSPKKPKPT